MARTNRKGRSTGSGRFVALHHFMLDTAAWRDLSPADRAVYVELAKLYDGSNNGRLALSARDAAERCRINKDTALRAFASLEEHGFVERVTLGGFSRKTRHASEWRLTMHRCNATEAIPSKAFQRWRPLSPQSGQSEESHGPKRGPSLSPETGQQGAPHLSTVRNEGTVSALEAEVTVRNEGTHIHSSHRPCSDTDVEGAAPEADAPSELFP